MTLGKVHFKFKDIWKVYLCFAVMFLWGVLLDFVIFPGSDYMYIVNDPLELNLNFPYQILYSAVLIVYVLIFYVMDFIITKLKRPKPNKNNQENK